MNARRAWRGDVVLVVVAAFAFATSGPLGKVASSIPAATIAALRTGIAAVVLFVFAPRAITASLVALRPKYRLLVALGGAILGVHFALFLGGLARTSLAAAVALVSLEPLSVVLVAFFAFGIRPTRRELFGLVVATGGALVVASGAGSGEHRLEGDLMVLGAVVLYGAYVAAARGARDALPGRAYITAVYAGATLTLLPFALSFGWGESATTSRSLGAVVALAFVPTLVGHSLVQLAARRVPPAIVALVSPGETIGALFIGAWMGAPPSSKEAVGAVVVLVGATIAILARNTDGNSDGGAPSSQRHPAPRA